MATLPSWIKNHLRIKKSPDFSADEQPLRGELLSIDVLKQYARTLAQDRRVESGRGPNILLPRLAANEKILRHYNERTLEVEKNRRITPVFFHLQSPFVVMAQDFFIGCQSRKQDVRPPAAFHPAILRQGARILLEQINAQQFAAQRLFVSRKIRRLFYSQVIFYP